MIVAGRVFHFDTLLLQKLDDRRLSYFQLSCNLMESQSSCIWHISLFFLAVITFVFIARLSASAVRPGDGSLAGQSGTACAPSGDVFVIRTPT